MAGGTVWVAPIEYVILMKLVYFRDGGSERHLRDISAMPRISGPNAAVIALPNAIEQVSSSVDN